ncbi:MAG: hypothetical protein Q9159_005976 [Coniocarpon cinnabarinum]
MWMSQEHFSRSERDTIDNIFSKVTSDVVDKEHDLLYICRDATWSTSVPAPSNISAEDLRKIHHNLGGTPPMKPHVSIGYSESAFSNGLARAWASIFGALPGIKEPWFPFFIAEYKVKQPLAKARIQALRDGSTAVYVMHGALKACTGKDPPSHATAVFSLCMSPEIAELRIHWRNVCNDGVVEWPAALVGGFDFGEVVMSREKEVFRLRGAILKISRWAQTNRWHMLQQAMLQCELGSPLDREVRPPTFSLPQSSSVPPENFSKSSINQQEREWRKQSILKRLLVRLEEKPETGVDMEQQQQQQEEAEAGATSQLAPIRSGALLSPTSKLTWLSPTKKRTRKPGL